MNVEKRSRTPHDIFTRSESVSKSIKKRTKPTTQELTPMSEQSKFINEDHYYEDEVLNEINFKPLLAVGKKAFDAAKGKAASTYTSAKTITRNDVGKAYNIAKDKAKPVAQGAAKVGSHINANKGKYALGAGGAVIAGELVAPDATDKVVKSTGYAAGRAAGAAAKGVTSGVTDAGMGAAGGIAASAKTGVQSLVDKAKNAGSDAAQAVSDTAKSVGNMSTGAKVAGAAAIIGGAALAAHILGKINQNIDWKVDGCDNIKDVKQKNKCMTSTLNKKLESLNSSLSKCASANNPKECTSRIQSEISSTKNKIGKLI